ncbi:MAG: tRNA dihydrouridine synthase DusB [Acholeplasmataceae bacterium]|nr:tRNA dihydrouridine synthase DusB [Acholeplasmataceae bacterium]
MYIGNVKIEGKLALAPLAGYTNKVYRKICHDMGASLTYTEMISDKGLLYENEKTWKLCEIDKNEHPTALQLFGGDIDELTKAAKLIDARSDCDIIDINMGCPVKKVLKAGSGSSLLRNVEYLEKMVRSVVQNVSKPVTVKMRIGFDHNSLNYLEVAKAIERAGAKAICVHGRTKSDFYSGKVNLEAIKEIKENVSIPVIGNGDVKTVEDLDNMLKTGVDLVMIGRASFGNPWIFEEFNAHLNNIPYVKKTDKERIEFLLYHLSELVKLKGETIAILEMRSLASWYVKGMKNNKEFKQKLINIKTVQEFKQIITECFQDILEG